MVSFLNANVKNHRCCEGLGHHWQMTLLATSVHFMVRRSFLVLRVYVTEATDDCVVSLASNEGQGKFLRHWSSVRIRPRIVLRSRSSVRVDRVVGSVLDRMWSLSKRCMFALWINMTTKVSLVEHRNCKRKIAVLVDRRTAAVTGHGETTFHL